MFRYLGNPNGSANDIAGISNERGNVVGLMPHPEHNVDPLVASSLDGLPFFASLAAVLARVAAALQDHGPGATQDVVWITHAGVIRSVAWLKAHGNGVLPRSEEWPVAAPGWGEWERIELG